MITYPIAFLCEAAAKQSVDSWQCKSPHGTSTVAIPVEFDGPGGGLSPEDLFNQALANCFVATFKVFAAHSKLSFAEVSVESKLIVDRDENKQPVMKEVFLDAKIFGAVKPELALSVARKAAKSGFVINSVKTLVHFDFKVE